MATAATTGKGGRRWRFTAEQYRRMGETGIFHEDDRVELIDGKIIAMTPIGPQHAASVLWIGDWFSAHLGARALVSVQNPVHLSEHDEPQPDIALLRRPHTRYRQRLPRPDEVFLLIEVADISLHYDQTTKLPRYARAGIAEVWIVDLTHDRVEVYRDPHEGTYRRRETYGRDDAIPPLAFPDLAVPCDEILP